jgi:transposase
VSPPSPRRLAWLFRRDDEAGTDADREFLAAPCARSPAPAVRDPARRFVRSLVTRGIDADGRWLAEAEQRELRRLARGPRSGDATVRAASRTERSNGPTAGQIYGLALPERAMYGRGELDLRQRLLRAA